MAAQRRAHIAAAGVVAAAVAFTAFAAPAHAAPGEDRAGPDRTAQAAAVSSESAKESAKSKQRHRATQRAMEQTVAAGIPGVLAATKGPGGVWKSTAGVGNRETGAPRGKDDRFRIASITKTFVATVLLQMEAEGRLDLDDTVEKHLPGLVAGNGNDGNTVTVRQLLNHTSGLFDYLADEAYATKYLIGEGFLKHRYDTLAPEFHIRTAMSHPPKFAPGSRFDYSNTNYVLAGLLIEKLSGTTYEEQVGKRIIKPLGLRSTTQPGDSIHMPKPSGRAYSSLYLDPVKTYDVTEMNGSQGWGDGDIISTAGDLNRFFSALMRGRLLPAEQLKAMKTTVPAPVLGGEDVAYGLGILTQKTSCGTRLWGHGGGIVGSLSNALTTEDGRRQLAYNLNGDWAMPVDIAEAEFCSALTTGKSALTAGKSTLTTGKAHR